MEEKTQDNIPSGLSIQDIANLIQIIDYAADQGAFKGWDNIRQILASRDKAATFVSMVQAQQESKEKEEKKEESTNE